MTTPLLLSALLAVTSFRHIGPIALQTPVRVDTTDVEGRAFREEALLRTPLSLERLRAEGRTLSQPLLTRAQDGSPALHLAAFRLTNTSFAKAALEVGGLEHYELYVDGKAVRSGEDLELQPAAHEVVVKALVTRHEGDTLSLSVAPRDGAFIAADDDLDAPRPYTLDDVMHARRYTDVSLSPDGRWMIVATAQTLPGGQTERLTEVREVATGKVVDRREGLRWMPRANLYYYTRARGGRRTLVAVDPATQAQTLLAADLPEGSFEVCPSEDRLLFTLTDKAPAERADIYEVIHPDDRQPGWRTRSRLALYDIRSGVMQPLTFGHTATHLADISRDGRYALVMTSRSILGQRPTERTSLFKIDLATFGVDTLLLDEGFVSSAAFSPDAAKVAILGSPEALGGVGKNLPRGLTPSMMDGQVFCFDTQTRQVTPLTRDFDPSVAAMQWSPADGKLYLRAEDKDRIALFTLDPSTGKIARLGVPEDVVGRFALAADAPVMALYGQSASNSDRLYAVDLKRAAAAPAKAVRLLEDLSADNLRGVELGECLPFTYVNPEGDSICCRYYLPPHFDTSRAYPMIVNYYGGCSPTSRNLETRYPQHAYAALGYVVLVVNPRGATGFGQKWSATHVNTAGEGVAQDIIGAVEAFCREHQWVDSKKIGCIGASYGGFMTQYLQTQTDLFAAAVSHAGISDHTSYWGEGYWGYSYSEVSMAGSYPWTSKELYVGQSPLFNAEKIHTPLLFVHGDDDHNVPVGESIQMYTALKLLGRPTAMVLVKDQDHWIQDYEKRRRWQQTIWAWFAKWLKEDPAWWQNMYPEKDL